ncbi:Uncharacterised protein [Mycobacteroides abscessus subsp. abscessus]|nr:Uncharacterised protein [Mycobacteroides abscessus subsp. abscessus]
MSCSDLAGMLAATASANSLVATIDTGAKSFTASYRTFCRCGTMAICGNVAMKSV